MGVFVEGLILAALALYAVWAVRRIVLRRRAKGGCAGCDSCAGCGGCAGCASRGGRPDRPDPSGQPGGGPDAKA